MPTYQYTKFRDAPVSQGAFRYLKPGLHRIRINKVSLQTGQKGEYCALEGTIVSSTSAEPDMAPGMHIDWSTHADKPAFKGNVKNLACAVFNADPREVQGLSDAEWEELFGAMVGENQAGAGKLVDADCVLRTSKVGNTYTYTHWRAVEDQQAR